MLLFTAKKKAFLQYKVANKNYQGGSFQFLIFDSKLNILLKPIKDDRAFSLLHHELPQILVLCFP